MNLLIVDDETGIREGMAAYLRLEGHRVRTASTTSEALALIAMESFDAIVTDWALEDADASAILLQTDRPCFVVTGHPEMVRDPGQRARVLTKPVMPADLAMLLVAGFTAAEASDGQDPGRDPVVIPSPRRQEAGLPVDTAARVELVRWICGSAEFKDDGEFVSIDAPLPDDEALTWIETIANDFRVIAGPGGPRVELRVHRDGRPAGIEVHSWRAPWPDDGRAIAVDLDTEPCRTVAEFTGLLDRASAARGQGRRVDLLNVPSPLRLFAEALGSGAELPKRVKPGPRLPEVLSELWR